MGRGNKEQVLGEENLVKEEAARRPSEGKSNKKT